MAKRSKVFDTDIPNFDKKFPETFQNRSLEESFLQYFRLFLFAKGGPN